jgi:hypothetical protein
MVKIALAYVPIRNAILGLQPITIHIQPPGQRIGLYIQCAVFIAEAEHKLRGRTIPFGITLGYHVGNRLQYWVRRFLPELLVRAHKVPQTGVPIKAEMQPHIRLVPSGDFQNGVVSGSLVLAENKSTIRGTKQTIGAGDGVKYIFCALFPRMVYKNRFFVSQKAFILLTIS